MIILFDNSSSDQCDAFDIEESNNFGRKTPFFAHEYLRYGISAAQLMQMHCLMMHSGKYELIYIIRKKRLFLTNQKIDRMKSRAQENNRKCLKISLHWWIQT